MFYLRYVKAEKGIAVVMQNDIVKRMTKVEYYNDGLIFDKVSVKSVNTVIEQVDMTMMMRTYTISVTCYIKKEDVK